MVYFWTSICRDLVAGYIGMYFWFTFACVNSDQAGHATQWRLYASSISAMIQIVIVLYLCVFCQILYCKYVIK